MAAAPAAFRRVRGHPGGRLFEDDQGAVPEAPGADPMLDSIVQKYLQDGDPGAQAPFAERALGSSVATSATRPQPGGGASGVVRARTRRDLHRQTPACGRTQPLRPPRSKRRDSSVHNTDSRRPVRVSPGPIRAQHRDRRRIAVQVDFLLPADRPGFFGAHASHQAHHDAGMHQRDRTPRILRPCVPLQCRRCRPSARRAVVVEGDAAMPAGHPSAVREHAPVVPGCGYRISD